MAVPPRPPTPRLDEAIHAMLEEWKAVVRRRLLTDDEAIAVAYKVATDLRQTYFSALLSATCQHQWVRYPPGARGWMICKFCALTRNENDMEGRCGRGEA